MQFKQKTKGSSLVVALGLMSLLLILGGAVMTTIFRSAHLTNNVANANKAYFSAEAGLEEALYELSNHLAGFEAEDSLAFSNNAKYDYTIEYHGDADSVIPRPDAGNSPSDTNWNKITYKETFNLNLFYDKSLLDNQTNYDCTINCDDIENAKPTTLNLYVRTPNGETLAGRGDVFVSWLLTGISKSNSSLKYTLLPITTKDFSNTEITDQKINNNELVLNINTSGAKLESTGSTTIGNFLIESDLHMPRLRLSVVSELKDNLGNPLPYLEFRLEANGAIVPDSFATITAEGYAGNTKQSIQTKVKQEGALSLFDYAIFQ